jgi:hypothetical protein
MAVTLLLLIIFLCLPDLEANYLTGFSPNINKALEQLFSTVIYAILSIGLLLCLSARLNKAFFNTAGIGVIGLALVLLFRI